MINTTKSSLEPGLFTGKESTPTSVQELTSYQEAEIIETHEVTENGMALAAPFSNPYPEQVPRHLIERSYLVQRTDWDINAPLALNYKFPYDLINFISPAIQTFKWMKAEVEIEIKINTHPFMQGALLVSWLPNHSTLAHRTGFRQQSANNPMIISLAQQNGLKFVIPWLNPYNYFPLDSTIEDSPFSTAIGTVDITPLFATKISADAGQIVTIYVYAKFRNSEVAGYRPVRTLMRAQSEVIQKTIKGLEKGVKTATDTVKSVFKLAPVVGELISLVGAFDKPTSVAALVPYTPALSRGMANGDGLDTGQTLSIDPNPLVSTEGFIVGNPDNTVPIQRIVCTPMLSALVTFDSSVVVDYKESVIPIKVGQTQPDYPAFVANMFQYWRGSFKYLFQFFCSPMISARFMIRVEYDNSGLGPIDGFTGDWVSKVVDVKGDTEVSMNIPYLWDTPYRNTVVPKTGTIYPLIHIYLIGSIASAGSETPAIHMALWRSGGEDLSFSEYRAPFFQYNAVSNEKQKMKAQSDPVSKFKMPFDSIVGVSPQSVENKFVRTEEYKTLNQLLHRFSETTFDGTSIPDTGVTIPGNFNMWSKIFKHWRGSRRIKLFPGRNGIEATETPAYNLHPLPTIAGREAGDGFAKTDIQLTNFLEVLVPWYSSMPFLLVRNDGMGLPRSSFTTYTFDVTDGLTNYGAGETNDSKAYIAGGDDFTYGYLYAPEVWIDPRPTSSKISS